MNLLCANVSTLVSLKTVKIFLVWQKKKIYARNVKRRNDNGNVQRKERQKKKEKEKNETNRTEYVSERKRAKSKWKMGDDDVH